MTIITPLHPDSTPKPCSDCGRTAYETATVFDAITGSTLTLCATCIIAFIQRQHFYPGCCGP